MSKQHAPQGLILRPWLLLLLLSAVWLLPVSGYAQIEKITLRIKGMT
jgi:hypothetical protein